MATTCTEDHLENSVVPDSSVRINVYQDSLDPAIIHPLEAYKYREYLYKSQELRNPKWDTLDEESTDLYVQYDIDLVQHSEFPADYRYKSQDFEKADLNDFGIYQIVPRLSLSVIGLHKHLYDIAVYLTGTHRKAVYKRT